MLQLLAPERVAIDSTGSDQYVEDSVRAIAPETLNKFRRGYGEHAAQVAQQLKQLVVTSAEGILRKAKLLLNMKERLNRQEWGIWLREVLGWFGSEATPYLQIGKVFKDFDPSVFRELEPFTILKLRTKRYAPVVARLQEEMAINSNLIQNFIKEVIPKQSRRKKAAPNYGEAVLKQRVNAEDGTSYFNLNANLGDKPGSWLESKLKDRTVGQVLEQAAAWEQQQDEERRHDRQSGLEAEVEQRVRNRVEMAEFALKREIAELKAQLQVRANPLKLVEQTKPVAAHQSSEQNEATALRTQQKSPAQLSEDDATYPKELHAVVDDARLLLPKNSSEGEELTSSDRAGAEFEDKPALAVAAFEDEVALSSDEVGENLETQVTALITEQTADYGCEASNATNSPKPAPGEASAQLPEAVQQTVSLTPSEEASAADCPLISPAWNVLKQLRGAEADLHKIDNQIPAVNFPVIRLAERETTIAAIAH